MFADLDASLSAVCADAGAPALVRAAQTSFRTPDQTFAPSQATINFFLHEVAENRDLREDGRFWDNTDHTWSFRPLPMRVDCRYLVTAWSTNTADAKVQEEHRLLGLALAWLSRFPVLTAGYLQGALATDAQPYPLPMTVAQVREGRGMGEFWSALGIAPRPSFSVTVTLSVMLSDAVEEYPEVAKIGVAAAQLDQPALSGRVLDATLKPVTAAQVAMTSPAGLNQQSAVGPAGDFVFSGVPFGMYTLTVKRAGQPDVPSTIAYDDQHQTHNLILTGP